MKLIKVSIKCRDSWSKVKSKSLKGKIFVMNLIKVTIKCRAITRIAKKCLCLHLTRPKVNLWLFSSRRQCGWSRQKYLIRSIFHILCDIQPDVTNRYTVLCVQIPRHLVSRPHDPFKSPTRASTSIKIPSPRYDDRHVLRASLLVAKSTKHLKLTKTMESMLKLITSS